MEIEGILQTEITKEEKATPPTPEEVKRMRILRKIKKVETYSLYIGLIMIFVGVFVPVLSYVSTGCFVLTYITALIKQKLQTGKITIISFVLGTAAITWLIMGQFVESPYIQLFGQVILYSYLMNMQYTLLGKVHKSFIFISVGAIVLGTAAILYPSKPVDMLNFLMQLFILYRFLDPVLEKIGQAHRKKRLALEAKQQEKSEDENKTTKNFIMPDIQTDKADDSLVLR